jgi:hypothetical protein
MADEEDGGDLKDLTATSFGLIIAYLLPGLVGLYGLSFWFPRIGAAFATFLTAESNVGLFFLIILASLAVGMITHGIRWILFEVWCSGLEQRLEPSLFANLSGERKLAAFRTAVDEIYRYHQWWGGMAVVAPLVFIGWMNSPDAQVGEMQGMILWIAFLALEALVIFAAWRVWCFYVARLRSILLGVEHHERSRRSSTGTAEGA